MNYCDFLFNCKNDWLENTALIDAVTDRRFSYRELQVAVRRMASQLRLLGLKPGDVLAIHLYNSAQVVITHLASQYVGCVSCLLDPLNTPHALDYYLKDSGAICLFTHLKKEEIPNLPREVRVIEEAEIDDLFTKQVDDQLHQSFSFQEDQVAAIFYTSGTTHFPKGVLLSPKNFLSHARIFSRCCYNYLPSDKLLCFVPFSHGYGSKSLFIPCLQAGATFVIFKSFQPYKVVEIIEREGITHLFGVPSHYQQLLRKDELIAPLRKLKAAFSAAALLQLETARLWKEKVGFYLDEGYGLIETCTGVIFRTGRLPDRLGNIGGYPSDLIDVEIMDEERHILPLQERGEIVVRGDSVMKGYLNKPAETAAVLVNGWFSTGDMGYKTTLGDIVLTGRLKDVINIAGIKVAPFEVESVLNDHPEVIESAVVGVDDEIYGEVVKAFVKLTPHAKVDHRNLQLYLQKKLMNFQVPKEIVFLEHFPRNNMGKIDKKALKLL
ncbi:MAG: AMP-dependent synthetase [Calditrichaeota bacterium]|nr:MAG: AMP-dependent synthetase [Calditrichota bacterium]